MGTNYYLHTGRKVTKECDLGFKHRVPEVYHIGKSSYGWYFTLHAQPLKDGTVLDSLKAWQEYYGKCPKPVIKDEYGETMSPEDMWTTITREHYTPRYDWDPRCRGNMPVWEQVHPGCAVYGDKGLVHVANARLGEDGLYTILEGEFS